jgi:hypothetical protein
LVAFEIFNYGTTEFAFKDLLGDLSFVGVHWATILALAFSPARSPRQHRSMVSARSMVLGSDHERHAHLVGREPRST